ncbi:MAG: GYF domain-containing protein [Pirellulales bacterium]|nr:GYF domain-containing protein [Pirellulales bacterium]
MGIKVVCPNGHRLVVNDDLAGKRGICPKCKVAFVIKAANPQSGDSKPTVPATSVKQAPDKRRPRVGSQSRPRQQPGPASKTPPATTSPSAQGKSVPQPLAKSQQPAPQTESRGKAGVPTKQRAPLPPPPTSEISSGGPPPDLPNNNGVGPAQPSVKSLAGVASDDPIAESPQLAWYVRHPNGSQYGPAKGELMRQWLAEDRIGSDSMAWREDWPEWRRADQIFPQLATEAPLQPSTQSLAKSPSDEQLVSDVVQPVAKIEHRTRRGQAHRRRQQRTRLIVSAVLLLIVIGLGITLAIVLMR